MLSDLLTTPLKSQAEKQREINARSGIEFIGDSLMVSMNEPRDDMKGLCVDPAEPRRLWVVSPPQHQQQRVSILMELNKNACEEMDDNTTAE